MNLNQKVILFKEQAIPQDLEMLKMSISAFEKYINLMEKEVDELEKVKDKDKDKNEYKKQKYMLNKLKDIQYDSCITCIEALNRLSMLFELEEPLFNGDIKNREDVETFIKEMVALYKESSQTFKQK
jgi:hypothetical protein